MDTSQTGTVVRRAIAEQPSATAERFRIYTPPQLGGGNLLSTLSSAARMKRIWSPRPDSNRGPFPYQLVLSPWRIRLDLKVRSRIESRPFNPRARRPISSLASCSGQSNLTAAQQPSQQSPGLPRYPPLPGRTLDAGWTTCWRLPHQSVHIHRGQ